MSNGNDKEPHIGPQTRQIDWQDDGNSDGSSTCTSLLQESSTTEEQGTDHLSFLRGHGSSRPECEGRTTMVGSGTTEVEWQTDPPLFPRSHNRDGCVSTGLECRVSTGGLWSETE